MMMTALICTSDLSHFWDAIANPISLRSPDLLAAAPSAIIYNLFHPNQMCSSYSVMKVIHSPCQRWGNSVFSVQIVFRWRGLGWDIFHWQCMKPCRFQGQEFSYFCAQGTGCTESTVGLLHKLQEGRKIKNETLSLVWGKLLSHRCAHVSFAQLAGSLYTDIALIKRDAVLWLTEALLSHRCLKALSGLI